MDEMLWLTSRNGKIIHGTVPFKVQNLHYNQKEVGWLLEATINPPLEVPLPGYGKIYKIISSENLNNKQYEVINREFPSLHLFGFYNNDV
jgi:hypothetical protein